MDIHVKKAEIADSAALYSLNRAFNGDCTTEALIKDSLLNHPNEIVYIAYADGFPAGFVCGEICRSMCYRTMHGAIGELFVKEEYRKQGIATRLIRHVEDEFREMGILIVEIATSVENHAAQACYSSCGYTGKTKMIFRRKIG